MGDSATCSSSCPYLIIVNFHLCHSSCSSWPVIGACYWSALGHSSAHILQLSIRQYVSVHLLIWLALGLRRNYSLLDFCENQKRFDLSWACLKSSSCLLIQPALTFAICHFRWPCWLCSCLWCWNFLEVRGHMGHGQCSSPLCLMLLLYSWDIG